MADNSYGLAMGALEGLNKGLLAFADAKQKRQDREAEMAAKGLIYQDGKIVQDPAFLANEMKKEAMKSRFENLGKGIDFQTDDSGNLTKYDVRPEWLEAQKQIKKAEAEADPYRGLLHKMQIDENNRKKEDEAAALSTPYGKANTPADANVVKEAADARAALNDLVDQMIALRKENTGVKRFGPEANARGQQLSKQALLLKKKLDSLGVLSQSDLTIVNSIVPEDPLKIEWFGDPTMKKLEGVKADTENKVKSLVSSRIRPGGLLQGSQSPPPAAPSSTGIGNLGLEPTAGAQGKFPMTLKKGNKTATVSNAAELAEAQSEGWR